MEEFKIYLTNKLKTRAEGSFEELDLRMCLSEVTKFELHQIRISLLNKATKK